MKIFRIKLHHTFCDCKKCGVKQMLFIILILILVIWLVVSAVLIKEKQGESPGSDTVKTNFGQTSSRYYYLHWQKTQLNRHRELLKQAIITGNSAAVKVQRSMIAFIKSFISFLTNGSDE